MPRNKKRYAEELFSVYGAVSIEVHNKLLTLLDFLLLRSLRLIIDTSWTFYLLIMSNTLLKIFKFGVLEGI